MARTNGNKRKAQSGGPGKGRYLSKSSKKQKKSNDLYEASDSDPDEEKHAERYDKVDNYEYELPSDFEDEEIDEDLAFTEEDKKKYAGWFGEDEHEEQEYKQQAKRQRGEFADLDSSSEDEADDDEDDNSTFDEAEDDEQYDSQDEQQQQLQQFENGFAGLSSDEDGSADSESAEDEQSDEQEHDSDGLDDERHRAMLAAALGKELHQAAAAGAAAKRGVSAAARNAAVVAEAYPESEAHAAAAAGGELRLSDLLGGLSGAAGSSAAAGLGGARKLLEKLDKRSAPVAAPLPRTVAERLDRKAGYDDTKQEVTKWQPIVKANREAPTLRFTSARHEVSAAAASTAALVDGFSPDTSDPDGLEAQVAALLGAAGSAAAAAMEEAEQALAEKAYSAEEAKARADKLAKMRNLMFYAELKAKRLAKIKSKEHHRRANKAAKRAAARAAEAAGDAEAEARAAAEDAEFERAKERLTLKHKNSSKWARRALKRGAGAVDVSTREALAAQLALGQQLRRKMEGNRDDDSSGDASDDSTSASEAEDTEAAAASSSGKLMSSKNRKEALAILKGLADPAADAADGALAGDDSSSKKKGLFALPFMVRALEKQRAAAAQEAAAMLAGMDGGVAATGAASAADEFMAAAAAAGGDSGSGGAGRMTFGGPAGVAAAARAAAVAALEEASGSDSEEDVQAKAERLGRHTGGEAAAGTGAAPAAANGLQTPAAGKQQQGHVSGRVQQQNEQRPQQQAADVGTIEIELPGQGVAAGQSTAAEAAAVDVAGPYNGSAHADLFGVKPGKRRQQQHLQQGGGDAEPSTSQPPAFMACKTWQGPKEGYVFKRDKQGLGYYSDSKAAGKRQSKQGRQQQKPAGVQSLLQRQQQAEVEAGSDSDGDAAPAGRQQNGSVAAGAGSKQAATAAAGAAVDAMQLLSGEGDLQRQLLAAAFAGDDVEADFAADKAAEVEQELPSDQVEGQLPGWGTWKTQQREPAWMTAAKAKAAAQRTAAAASRKDAQLKNVVISEKWDKKSSKYLAANLPFPFRDKDVYETAIRQPLGRQYNPDAAFRNLTRPAVLKDAGVIIEPLRHSKHVEQYNSGTAGKNRAVVTVAGGMQLQGQAAGTGAGGVGKGTGQKGRGGPQQQKGKAGAGSKRGRLHEAQ